MLSKQSHCYSQFNIFALMGGPLTLTESLEPAAPLQFKHWWEKQRQVPIFVINIIQMVEEIKWPEGQAGQQTPRCSRLSISDSASFSHSSLKLPASDKSVDYHRKVHMHFSRHATDLNISFTANTAVFIMYRGDVWCQHLLRFLWEEEKM